MQVSWGSLGDTGIVQVVVEPILKPAHQHLFWPIHTAFQVSEFLHVFAYEPVALPHIFDVVCGFVVSKGVFKPLSQGSHKAVEVLELRGICIMEGHHPSCSSFFQG